MDARRPHVVALRVRSLDRSVAFWRDVLNVPLKLRTDGYAEMQTETVLLALLEDAQAAPASATPAIGWEVEDLEAAVRELEARGVRVEPEEAGLPPASGRRRGFRDPDGHRLELIHHPRP